MPPVDFTPQLQAILTAIDLVDDNPAHRVAILVGALTLLCARSNNPVGSLEVAIGSLNAARDICLARIASSKGQPS